jgi:hypothetical protein
MTVEELGRIDQGDDLRVFYISQRSGNEVEREGVVADVLDGKSGNPFVMVHTEEVSPFKHKYVALTAAETESGRRCVGARSITAEADRSGIDEPPMPRKVQSYTLEITRESHLGLVDRVIIDQPGGAMFLTVLDGDSDTE